MTSSPTVTICSCLNSLSEGKVENITNHCSVQFETSILPSITGFCSCFVLHSWPRRRLCDSCEGPSVNSNRIPVSHCILASSLARVASSARPRCRPAPHNTPTRALLLPHSTSVCFPEGPLLRVPVSSVSPAPTLALLVRSCLAHTSISTSAASSFLSPPPPPLPPPLTPAPSEPPPSPTLSPYPPCSPSSRLHH